jgi:hypothetical protein
MPCTGPAVYWPGRGAQRETGNGGGADDIGAWLVAAPGDAGRRRATGLILGSEQEQGLGRAGPPGPLSKSRHRTPTRRMLTAPLRCPGRSGRYSRR